jgi:hypothetical protein
MRVDGSPDARCCAALGGVIMTQQAETSVTRLAAALRLLFPGVWGGTDINHRLEIWLMSPSEYRSTAEA